MVATPSDYWSTVPTADRRVRRIGAVALGLALLVLVEFGTVRWVPEIFRWGMTGHRVPCAASATCSLAWRVDQVDVTLAAQGGGPQPGMDVCRYAPGGAITPGQFARSLNRARELWLSSDGCQTMAPVVAAPLTDIEATVYFFIGIICAILAVELFLLATRRRYVRHAVAALAGVTAAYAWLPAATYNDAVFFALEPAMTLAVAPALLATLLWRLALGEPPNGAWRAARRVLFTLAGAGVVAVTLTRLLAERAQSAPLASVAARLAALVFAYALALAFAAILIGLFAPAFQARRSANRVLGYGALVALLPVTIFGLIPMLLALRGVPVARPIDPRLVAVSVIALPIAMTFVILRRDLLRVDALIRASVERGLGLFALFCATSVLIAFFSSAFKDLFGVAFTNLSDFFTSLVAVALALLAPILFRATRWVTEGWIFPYVRRYQRVLSDSTEAAGGTDPDQIATALIGEIRFALPVREVALFIEEEQSGRFARARDQLTPDAPQAVYDGEHALVAALRQSEKALDGAPPDEWTLLAPVRSRDRLIAFVALGPRDDRLSYSGTDRALILALARRRAVALDYSRMLLDLRLAYTQQQVLDHLKDQFILTAHHELRTPLTALTGYIELLRDLGDEHGWDSPDARYFLDRAFGAANDLAALMSTLLDADPVRLDPSQVRREPLPVAPVAERAAEAVAVAFRERARRISVHVADDAWVMGDEQALTRVLTNLLSNAVKYSPDDAPVVLSARRRAAVIEIAVRDWGAGIPPEEQATIFERFVRLERDINSPVRGTGLGLFVAQSLVRAMGGAIWLESEGVVGAGCAFRLTLPAVAAVPLALSPPATTAAPDSPGTTTP